MVYFRIVKLIAAGRDGVVFHIADVRSKKEYAMKLGIDCVYE